MVQLMKNGELQKGKMVVKMEIEDALEDEYGPLNKRSKQSYPLLQVCSFFLFFF